MHFQNPVWKKQIKWTVVLNITPIDAKQIAYIPFWIKSCLCQNHDIIGNVLNEFLKENILPLLLVQANRNFNEFCLVNIFRSVKRTWKRLKVSMIELIQLAYLCRIILIHAMCNLRMFTTAGIFFFQRFQITIEDSMNILVYRDYQI